MKKIYAAALAALVHAGIAFAQTDAPAPSTPAKSGSDSELVVVTVTKNAQVETKVGSAFTRIGSAEIQRAQSVDLTQVLSATPGVFAGDTGARGSIPLVSIRGNRTDHTLFLLDGVRINTAMNQDAKPFLSYAGAENIGSVEIVRGPQSTLYGSEGIGGVVAMETKKGEGKPGVTLFSEAGSFHSFREGIAGGGEFGKTAFSMSYQRDDTCNDRPNNDLSTNRYSLRLDYQPLDNLSLQFNVRGHAGEYQEPGSSRPQDYASNDPGARATGESNLVSAIIDWKVLPQWEQKLTLGAYFERYTFIDPPYAGNYFYPTHYISNAANYSADWQQVVQVAHNNRLTAGLDFNYFTGHDNTFANQGTSDWAAYFQDEWEPVKNLSLTGGLRYDRYELAGGALTYRFTGAYLIAQTDTKIRASYGTGFKAPDFFKMYSTSSYALGNPGLKPEKSAGWDVGVDQYLLHRNVVLSATYFHNHIRDLIAFVQTGPFTGSYLNRDTADNDGVEFGAQVTLFGNWKNRFAYTYTESTFTSSGASQRRDDIPKHALSLDTSCLFFKKWLVGCGASYLAGRVDTDYSTWPASKTRLADYFTMRVYSRYEINDHVAVFARGENLTNKRYENKLGNPALPIGVFGGVELKF